MLVGYCRVSVADDRQATDLQRDALLSAGVDKRNIYEDRASGAKDNRPGLKACLDYLSNGDVLVVWRLDRLGRSLPHLIEIVLQIAMGWSDDHLHQFRIHGKRYGIARMGGILFSDDPDAVRLKDLGLRINERFVYEYDFTDNWQHLIRVEAILAPEPHRHYPLCIDGRRACPPEDCGGPWAFMDLRQNCSFFHIMERLLEIIEDGGSQDHQEGLEALHYWMHIDRFDRKGTNRRLYDYARGEKVFMWA